MRRYLLPLTMLFIASLLLATSATAQLRRAPRTLRTPTLRVTPIQPTLQPAAQPAGLYFSTEEDFMSHNAAGVARYVSDGDLLTGDGRIFRRNKELLGLIAFSTELDDPRGRFTAGDLLATNGAVLPNAALLAAFRIPKELDLGLDALHFVGKLESIRRLLDDVKERGRIYWVQNPNALLELLKRLELDIWFSTEGTAPPLERPAFLDGDLLSIKGANVAPNSALLPATVPAGIPSRGVDFGLDAVASDRSGDAKRVIFSTSILFGGKPSFTDGDLLRFNNGVVVPNATLLKPFAPKAPFLGLDALSAKPGK